MKPNFPSNKLMELIPRAIKAEKANGLKKGLGKVMKSI